MFCCSYPAYPSPMTSFQFLNRSIMSPGSTRLGQRVSTKLCGSQLWTAQSCGLRPCKIDLRVCRSQCRGIQSTLLNILIGQ